MLLSAETRQYLTGFSSGLGSRGGDGRRKAELPGFHSVRFLRVVLIGVDVAIKRQMSKTLMEAWM